MEHESSLSDALLRQLMAVGQVDILVGLPTLNNAETVVTVARAIEVCFARDFARQRTVMINTDAGSTDGTLEMIRNASFADSDVVQTSHSLRTLHRVVTPYHGLPGRHTALRTVFAAAELTQAKTLVVVDPAGPATTADRVTELITPIARSDAEFLAPRYRRHPRDGALITQLVRPLIRAVYGVGLDEPLGAEFSCSGRFVSHCLAQDIWKQDAASFAIDLWLRTEAISQQFPLDQIWRPATTPAAGTTLRQAVRQILISLIATLRAHESFWRTTTDVSKLRTWGRDQDGNQTAAEWDFATLEQQARHDLTEIQPLLESVLAPPVLSRLMELIAAGDPPLDDEMWIRSVYDFLSAAHRGRGASVEQLADMFVPIYIWRAARFMSHTELDPADVVQSRLNALCDGFQRLKPALVSGWAEV